VINVCYAFGKRRHVERVETSAGKRNNQQSPLHKKKRLNFCPAAFPFPSRKIAFHKKDTGFAGKTLFYNPIYCFNYKL
jgi:hypothetical protein